MWGGQEPGQFDAFLSAVYYMSIGGPGSDAEAIGIEIINTIAQSQGGASGADRAPPPRNRTLEAGRHTLGTKRIETRCAA